MLTLRKAADRGRTDIGWLDSRHSFSFGEYHDRAHMGFGALRVINEDIVAGGGGFAPHGHRDMEIISYVVSGGLAHRDSSGGEGVIRPGRVQKMSAGAGVIHSEYNASATEPVHFLQIWLVPDRLAVPPKYEEAAVPGAAGLHLIAARTGAPVSIEGDARLYAGRLAAGGEATLPLGPGRRAWVQVVRGAPVANGAQLGPGDGAAIEDEVSVTLAATGGAEALVFDLA